MSATASQIGHRIKIRRMVLQITQQDLAKAIGTAQPNVASMERGHRVISSEMLDRIATALQCKPEDLLDERRKLA